MSIRACVIGGGPAGLSAAIYLGNSGINPVVYSGLTHVSQLSLAPDIRNFPGIPATPGTTILQTMESQAESSGASLVPSDVTRMKELHTGSWSVELDGGGSPLTYDAVIVASGNDPRIPDVPGIVDSVGNRIYTCALCDGGRAELDGTNIIVYGGGRSAVEYARYLKSAGKDRNVIVLCRHALRDQSAMESLSGYGITVEPNTVITEAVHSSDGLHISGVSSGTPFRHGVSAVFIAAGSVPSIGFMTDVRRPFSPGKLNKYGASAYIDEYEDRGLYMCGSVLNGFYGVPVLTNQAAVCAASGISAAARLISAIQHGKFKEMNI